MTYPSKDRSKESDEPELIEKLVSINRVAKVVKGGRRFGFAALVVVGDGQGRVGIGSSKAREVPEAIRKATNGARKKMLRVQLREGRTLHHDIIGRFGRGKVLMRSAVAGTGIIAGGPVRAVFEALGVSDVVVKSIGSSNPHNMIKAALDGLMRSSSPRKIALRRGKRVSEIVRERNIGAQSKPADDKPQQHQEQHQQHQEQHQEQPQETPQEQPQEEFQEQS